MRLFSVFTLMLLSLSSVAEDVRFIQVSGNASIEAMPDYLDVNLAITTTQPSLKKAKRIVDTAVKNLLQVSEKLNIDEKDIDAAHISNQPHYEWRKNGREYRGEQVSRNITITLRNKDNYANLLHELMNIKEIRVHGSEMKFDDRQSWQNKALIKAINAAKNKASLMAQASDNKIGAVLSLQEQGAHAPQPMMMSMGRMEKMEMMDSAPAPMLIQKQTISAAVIIRYRLTN